MVCRMPNVSEATRRIIKFTLLASDDTDDETVSRFLRTWRQSLIMLNHNSDSEITAEDVCDLMHATNNI
jgi:hypothetical protein